jgi:hypothetical protein
MSVAAVDPKGVAAALAVVVITAGADVKRPPSSSSACTPAGTGLCHYVDAASGNDANPGTSSRPFRTLQRAARIVGPGDVVIVGDGVYTGERIVLNLTRSGSAGSPIVFRAEHKWRAVIDGQNNRSVTGIHIGGSYIRVEGFEIRGTSRYGIDAYDGSGAAHDVQIVMNHIHAIGRICTDDKGGRVAVSAYVDNLVVERNVMHDVGRLGPGEQGCNPTNAYWQNHDHGVYHGEGDNVVIRNNVFYNFTRGWAIHRYNGKGGTVSGLSILNNTFAFPNPNRDGQVIISTSTTNLVIENNIFYRPRTAGVEFDVSGLSGVTVSNNLTYGGVVSTGTKSGITFSSNLDNTDPRFVSVSGLDFHLQSGSPAIDTGLPLLTVLTDLDGVSRPQGAGYDRGAYDR